MPSTFCRSAVYSTKLGVRSGIGVATDSGVGAAVGSGVSVAVGRLVAVDTSVGVAVGVSVEICPKVGVEADVQPASTSKAVKKTPVCAFATRIALTSSHYSIFIRLLATSNSGTAMKNPGPPPYTLPETVVKTPHLPNPGHYGARATRRRLWWAMGE